jgi:ArsR family transcriptional regulator
MGNDIADNCLTHVEYSNEMNGSMGDLSEAFKALGHPHRLALVRRLIDQAMTCEAPSDEACTLDPACCDFGELAEEIGVGKPTVSHHLKVLRQADLIERIQEGRRVHCRINEDRLADLRSFLSLDPNAAPVEA